MLSNVLIETSGGASPIRCHGHHKGDAVRMKTLIEQYQSDYYRRRVAEGKNQSRTHVPPCLQFMDDLTFSARRDGAASTPPGPNPPASSMTGFAR